LNSSNIVWHQFANREWGFVDGDIFVWNDWSGQQGTFAYELLRKISTGELNLPDSIDHAVLAQVEEYLNIEEEDIPYVFHVQDLPNQPGIVQIIYSSWGFTESKYIITVDASPVLSNMINEDGFMSYGQAISQGKLEPIPDSGIDTLSHNGILTTQNSSIQISEIKSVELSIGNPILDYQTGTYSMLISEMVNLNTKENSMLFQPDNEISGILMNKVREGLFDIYYNDSLTSQMTLEEFNKNLTVYYEEWDEMWYEDWDSTFTYSSWDGVIYDDIEYQSLIDDNIGNVPEENSEAWEPVVNESIEFQPTEVSILQITYRYNFDQEGKILSSEPIALGLHVSPQFVETGIMMPICTFNFKDVEQVFSNDIRTEININGESVKMTDIIRDHRLMTYYYDSRYIEYVSSK